MAETHSTSYYFHSSTLHWKRSCSRQAYSTHIIIYEINKHIECCVGHLMCSKQSVCSKQSDVVVFVLLCQYKAVMILRQYRLRIDHFYSYHLTQEILRQVYFDNYWMFWEASYNLLRQTQFNLSFSGIITNMSGVISIQGNLGAGKSTLLSLLNLSVIKEPVEEWEHMVGGNLLKNYYQDPKRWAFTFQLNALHSRNMLWNKTIQEFPGEIHFSERSPLADRQVFGEIMYRQGNLNQAEYSIYSELCAKMIEKCPLKAIIYLRCAPELCLNRIKKRNREGEESIPLEYLQKVHKRHEEWLPTLKNIPILTVDTGMYDIYSASDQQIIKTLIQNFIAQCSSSKERKMRKQTSELKGGIQILNAKN